MKLGVDQVALRGALFARLSRLPAYDGSDEFAKGLADTIAQAIDLNNRTILRQLTQAGVVKDEVAK